MMRIFQCDAPNNRTRWCSEEFEEFFQKGLRESDHAERLEYMREAERVLLREAPVVPLHVYTQVHLQKPYVRDLAINFPDRIPIHRAWIDPDWSEREGD
jgi:dipeptide transport system substrate-binding protein